MVGICNPLRSHSATDAYGAPNEIRTHTASLEGSSATIDTTGAYTEKRFAPLTKWFGHPLSDVMPSLSLEGGIRIYICIPIYTIYYKKSMFIFRGKERASIPLLQPGRYQSMPWVGLPLEVSPCASNTERHFPSWNCMAGKSRLGCNSHHHHPCSWVGCVPPSSCFVVVASHKFDIHPCIS